MYVRNNRAMGQSLVYVVILTSKVATEKISVLIIATSISHRFSYKRIFGRIEKLKACAITL